MCINHLYSYSYEEVFIFSVCCLFLLQAQSQDYIPLVEDGKVWNMELVSTWQSWPDYGVVRTEKWELKGDTVIGGVSYIKYYEDGEKNDIKLFI